MDNVNPYISGEEEKTETEPLKVLGKIRNGILEQIDLPISAICTRVASSDGHMANVFVEFDSDVDEAMLRNAIIDFENPIKRF